MALAMELTDLRLSGDEFTAWSDLLASRTGVVVPPERRMFLESNLRRRLRELKLVDFSAYWHLLQGEHGPQEWGTLVDRLTVHETHFFRHLPSYELIRRQLLPGLVASGRKDFHGWSVGCSTGEETWSLAMVVDHFARQQDAGLAWGVTGSDISQPSLETAREAIYRRAGQAEIPKGYRQRYTQMQGRYKFAIDAELKKRVQFARLNLLHVERKPLRDLDLIFCQNVLIYFPRDRRHTILHHFTSCLRPGGYLILGPGEITDWAEPRLERLTDPRVVAFRRQPVASQEIMA